MTHSALIIGGSSHIGRAIIDHLLQSNQPPQMTVVSRGSQPPAYNQQAWYQSDYSEHSMAELVGLFSDSGQCFDQVFICHGILHDDQVSPEKRLEDLDAASMQHVFQINAVTPVLWLKHLLPLLKQSTICKVAVFSARVGSISDNHLGGWYSYRASKAALNMLLKSAAIEYARRAPGVKILAFHPGTTDTPLSSPYSKNVPEGRLFQPAFVAARLLDILDSLEPDGELSFLDWQNEAVAW